MDLRPSAIKEGCLQKLHQYLFSSLQPLFIAIDFERPGWIANNFRPCSDTQAGVCVLDIQDITPQSRKRVLKLQTYNFVTGSDSYFTESAKKFLWDSSEKIHPSKMRKCISKLVPRNRDIVLVGHGFGGDLAALSALGFDLTTSIIGIFDTANLSYELEMGRSTLGRLLGDLECPKSSARLHNAGNDAYFTLRALILLAIKGYGDWNLGALNVKEEIVPRIEALRAVAMSPLPGAKKPKKRKPRKKHIAKQWPLEKQEEIREERRQRRITTAASEDLIFLSVARSEAEYKSTDMEGLGATPELSEEGDLLSVGDYLRQE